MKAIDVLGQTFGKLTVIGKTSAENAPDDVRLYWDCRCECGNVAQRSSSALLSSRKLGQTPACNACAVAIRAEKNLIDISGKTFGKLTVVGPAPTPANGRRGQWWTCLCSCGAECVRFGTALKVVANRGGIPACNKCIVAGVRRGYRHKSTVLKEAGLPAYGTYTIYCHTHTVTQKRYVGMTVNTMEERWQQHVRHATKCDDKSRNNYWYRAIRKHGVESFTHEVLEIVDTRGAAREAEAWWIAHFGSDDHVLGYNSTPGGDGYVMTADTRAKVSASVSAMLTKRPPEQVASFVAKCLATRARNRIAREAAALAASPQLSLLG